MKTVFTALVMMGLLSSCNSYYQTTLTSQPPPPGKIQELNKSGKYFILREGSQAFEMKDIRFSEDQQTLLCTLGPLSEEHQLHLQNGINGKMRYIPGKTEDLEKGDAVLNEVHVYVNTGTIVAIGPFTTGLNNIQKVEILEPDKARTRASHTTGAIIGVSATVLVAGAIVAIVAANSIDVSLSGWGY